MKLKSFVHYVFVHPMTGKIFVGKLTRRGKPFYDVWLAGFEATEGRATGLTAQVVKQKEWILMKSHDDLAAMNDHDLMMYLNEEVEAIIRNAPKRYVMKLRAMQAKMDGIRKRVVNPVVRAEMMYRAMIESLNELNHALKG